MGEGRGKHEGNFNPIVSADVTAGLNVDRKNQRLAILHGNAFLLAPPLIHASLAPCD